MQLRRSYIDDSLDDEEVQKFLARKKVLGLKAWTLYMISGLIIARGAKIVTANETAHRDFHVSSGVDVPGMAAAGVTAEKAVEGSTEQSWDRSSDFVWALRLTKVTKGLFDGDDEWKMDTVTKGATFSKGGGGGNAKEVEVDVKDDLVAGGVDLDLDVMLFTEEEGDIMVVPNADA